MTDDRKAPDAAQHISAASEERFIASTEEFASESSKATVLATNIIQALLVACVVLWVLDVPRQVFNVSFYTEQLLAVTLGPDAGARLHRRDVAAAKRDRSRRRCARRSRSSIYLVYHYYARGEIAWPVVGALAVDAGLDLHREPRRVCALVRLALRHRLAAARAATSPSATRR